MGDLAELLLGQATRGLHQVLGGAPAHGQAQQRAVGLELPGQLRDALLLRGAGVQHPGPDQVDGVGLVQGLEGAQRRAVAGLVAAAVLAAVLAQHGRGDAGVGEDLGQGEVLRLQGHRGLAAQHAPGRAHQAQGAGQVGAGHGPAAAGGRVGDLHGHGLHLRHERQHRPVQPQQLLAVQGDGPLVALAHADGHWRAVAVLGLDLQVIGRGLLLPFVGRDLLALLLDRPVEGQGLAQLLAHPLGLPGPEGRGHGPPQPAGRAGPQGCGQRAAHARGAGGGARGVDRGVALGPDSPGGQEEQQQREGGQAHDPGGFAGSVPLPPGRSVPRAMLIFLAILLGCPADAARNRCGPGGWFTLQGGGVAT